MKKVSIHPLIKGKQIELVDCVNSKIRIFITIKWKNSNKTMNSFILKNMLMDTLLKLQYNYTNYYKSLYEIEMITILEIINRNPHIKISSLDIINEILVENSENINIVTLKQLKDKLYN